MIRAGALALLAAGPASASVEESEAARCAALWSGYAAYAEVSAYLDTGDAAAQAAKWRDLAAAETGDAAAVDAYIAREARERASMLDAYIYSRDRQSREVFERAMARCE
ncbi:hypothetical protein OCH239_14280 [Roseivivax halodurans JCM 10272]|uniref:Uncharacterized protein n=1 Tax=Roseivivax halodurans JCM 10272 TaxID=1449350 RepID=X7EKI1_9RHOB|nr:hypothetical protein [Roseivivax halodurans]ETX15696.1 hypothetical protein OCH239_14280 [Roseivivax halodurans JCM 10272]